MQRYAICYGMGGLDWFSNLSRLVGQCTEVLKHAALTAFTIPHGFQT
jgi:hypothetical protein